MSEAERDHSAISDDHLFHAMVGVEHEIGLVKGYVDLLYGLLNEHAENNPLGNGVSCLTEAIERSVKAMDEAHTAAYRCARDLKARRKKIRWTKAHRLSWARKIVSDCKIDISKDQIPAFMDAYEAEAATASPATIVAVIADRAVARMQLAETV